MKRRHGTAAFFAITFAITWSLQLPGALARLGLLPEDASWYLPAALLGIFGPLVAATLLVHRESGSTGVAELFRRLFVWRLAPTYYLSALVVPGALLTLLLWLLASAGRSGRWLLLPSAPQIAVALVVAFAEETGWRGYALPRLIARHGAFAGSCLLGALWTAWHIPMFLLAGVPLALGPVMLLYFVGGSLYFTWLYQQTGGSLLIMVLAHVGAHLTNSHAQLPADAMPLVAHAVVYAGLGLLMMRSAAFTRRLPDTCVAARGAPRD